LEDVPVQTEFFGLGQQSVKEAPVYGGVASDRGWPRRGTEMQMVGKLMDCRIDQFLVRLEILGVEEDFPVFRFVETVDLSAPLASKDELEFGSLGLEFQKQCFDLILVHLFHSYTHFRPVLASPSMSARDGCKRHGAAALEVPVRWG
jgi:hypothetical protein